MIPAASAATAADLPALAGRSIITAMSLFTRTGFGVGLDAGYG
jgi:hypothetical protein